MHLTELYPSFVKRYDSVVKMPFHLTKSYLFEN